ncbi:MAG: flippase-like domain-containing protein [Rhodospirillales bacterium]|nr:flippase-like domain-containing protein [Rhodospirillales bacterium]
MKTATKPQGTKWRWLGAMAGLLLLAWALRNFDPWRFADILAGATGWPLLFLPVAVIAEQVLRALKWRQLLYSLRAVGIGRLFGSIMAGYFANFLTPVRVSPLVRAWLVARLEGLSVSTLLATIVLERLIDGLVFVAFAGIALLVIRFPDPDSTIIQGVAWGTGASLVAFTGLIGGLVALRRQKGRALLARLVTRLTVRLPERWRDRGVDLAHLFVDGVIWPRAPWRGGVIIVSAVLIKIIAISHFLWVGIAFDVILGWADYLFIMVFLSFLVILAGTLRIIGGVAAGAVFVLQGFGIDVETALAMTLLVQAASILTVAGCGAAALWVRGVSLSGVLAAGKGQGGRDD